MDMADNLRDFLAYHRRMFLIMLAVCLAAAAALFIAMPGDYAWGGGLLAGAAAQLLKFGLLDVATIRKIALNPDYAASTQMKAMFLSLILFGLAVVAVYYLRLNVWAMAAGIFIPRLMLLADTYIRPNPFAAASGKEGDD